MQALAVLCLALGTGNDVVSRPSVGRSHSLLLAQLRWLTATESEEASSVLYTQQTPTVAHHDLSGHGWPYTQQVEQACV